MDGLEDLENWPAVHEHHAHGFMDGWDTPREDDFRVGLD
jgi:hypothetical protein